MPLYNGLTILCWLIFLSYWILASADVKRDRNARNAWHSNGFAIRTTLIFIVVVATFALREPILYLFSYQDVIGDPLAEGTGVLLCACGIALAIWARVHLGRNWSDEPALKEGHVLVTSGPYTYIRHPIYAGVLLAAFGSVLVGGVVWIFVLGAVSFLFAFRMQKEEHLLSQEFSGAYASYRRRTRALIPFLL